MNTESTSLHALRSLVPFRDLPGQELKRMAGQMSLRLYSKKASILKQDEQTSHVFFILSGFVKVYRGGPNTRLSAAENRHRPRKEIALAILGQGHLLGELAALAQTKRSASVVALSDCTLIQFDYDAFIDCTRRNPAVALFVMQYLAKRVIEANRQIDLQLASIEGRVIALLRNLSDMGLPHGLYPSNAEIGRMVGSSREMVSRIVKKAFSNSGESKG